MDSGAATSAPEQVIGHTVSVVAIVGTLIGFLPSIATLLAILWYCLMFYESKTCQGWIVCYRARKTPGDTNAKD